MSVFFNLLRADMRLHAKQAGEWVPLLLFFLIVIVLLPFSLGPEPELLRRLAPGLIWLAALLMSLLALERLFVRDARDGTLDIMLLSPVPLPLIVASRMLTEIFVLISALTLMLPLAALLLGLSIQVLPVMLLTLWIGTPVLVLLGGIAGAITATLTRNPALLTVLLMPFYIPVLIFAVAASEAAANGANATPHLLLLGAMLAALLPIAPFIIAAALRNAQGQ